ncbi:MAG TPA: FliM/FliN family flagellar motor switch protein [Bryobacteraceae bacterium]|nr:FliM/FliN family flagellar motor switch protein [Bryobacteraceae bacterium]
MESNWTKAEFKTKGKLQGVPGELVRLANETLARELTISLSAFLRTSIAATYAGGGEIPYGEFPVNETQCFSLALTRPGDRKLLVVMQHSVLLPLVGIALGAKTGTFGVEERKPTEIELQVVSLLYRLILSDAYRSWATLMQAPLETVTLEFDPAPARILPPTEPVFAARFEIAAGEQTGQLTLLAPPELFATALEEEEPAHHEKPERAAIEATLDMLMGGQVSISVWLDGSQMRLGDLLRLQEGQVVRLDHPVDRRAVCTLNGQTNFNGQIVSTGRRRAFQIEDFIG